MKLKNPPGNRGGVWWEGGRRKKSSHEIREPPWEPEGVWCEGKREGRNVRRDGAFDSRLLFLLACACRRRLWPHLTHDAFGRRRWKVRRFAGLFFPSYCHKKTAANSVSFLIVIAGGVHQICPRFRGKDNGGEMIWCYCICTSRSISQSELRLRTKRKEAEKPEDIEILSRFFLSLNKQVWCSLRLQEFHHYSFKLKVQTSWLSQFERELFYREVTGNNSSGIPKGLNADKCLKVFFSRCSVNILISDLF
jgi:hypothetical protein